MTPADGSRALAVGGKHALKHSYENGSILSVGDEDIPATGDKLGRIHFFKGVLLVPLI